MGSGLSKSSSSDFSEADLISGLSEGRFKNIVIMCGAGISTNAGIPDFRSPSAGYNHCTKQTDPYRIIIYIFICYTIFCRPLFQA